MRSARSTWSFAVLLAAVGCASEPVPYDRPSEAERETRQVFVENHPDLPSVLRQQVLSFQSTPDAAIRRTVYLRLHPELPAGRQQLILRGDVRLGMTPKEVRACWGEPLDASSTAEAETWIYPVVSRRAADRHTRLQFERGRLIAIQRL